MVRIGVPMPKDEPPDHEITDNINKIIAQRTSYGMRSERTSRPCHALMWSNSGTWVVDRSSGVYQPGEIVQLDANEILAPYRYDTLERVLPSLRQLPLYSRSIEASSQPLSGPIDDKKWVLSLQEEGNKVWDGLYPTDFPGLKNIHTDADSATLQHLGGGDFADKYRSYQHADNPYTHHRFYKVREF